MNPSCNPFASQNRRSTSYQPTRRGVPSNFTDSNRQAAPSRFNESSRQSSQNSRQVSRFNPTRTGAQSTQRNQSTIIRPGQPHFWGTHVDYENVKMHSHTCRCQNPDSHGDAWVPGDLPAVDLSGRDISFDKICHKILDYYRKDSMTLEEELEAYPLFCHPAFVAERMAHERQISRAIAMGQPVTINPALDNVRHFNGDGHSQRFIGEQGLQTRMSGPSGGSRGGSRGGSFGGRFGGGR